MNEIDRSDFLKFHPNAYQFVFASLRHTQQRLNRTTIAKHDEEEAHISGRELLEGIRELAIQEFGLMARTVFRQWGIRSTVDFGKVVFDLVERGEMRKTDRDRLGDFVDVFDFEVSFDRDYKIETSKAFTS